MFDLGFTSETGAVFSGELDSAVVQGAFSNTVAALDNPIPSGYTFTPLTLTYYDDYSATSKSYTSANNSLVDDGTNSYAYALPSSAYAVTKGMVTSTKARVLQSTSDLTQGAWEENVNFYDDKGRAIQVQRTNNTGGKDTLVTQYTFAGVLLKTLACEAKAGANAQAYRTLTKNYYDPTWRLSYITKQVGTSAVVTVASNTYNQLGQLVTKRQGQKRNANYTYASAALDTLDYTYNIRGWVAGINRGYANPQAYAAEGAAQTGRWFGMELMYDFGFTDRQLNGNIAGTVWRNQGDGMQRAYGFAYDNANRLTEADFTQNVSGNTWNTSAGADFSVHSIGYDLNGNILKMNQMGMKPTSTSLSSSTLIDSLVYGYNANTNKLNYVTDKVNDTASLLGDFKEINNNTTQDYNYNGNGSLTQDNNKNISSIHYNYLNLPDSITITGKGAIRYIYDAAGTKLQKITSDNPANKQTVTTYVGSAVYQSSHPLNISNATGIDTLQYLAQEEGRIRPKNFGLADTMYYDYFAKDHLGNTRVVLTDELQRDAYPDASLEDATIGAESLYYTGEDTGRTAINQVPGYPTDTYTSPNNYTQKLNGSGPRVGTGILLKVMAGDSILVRANSWYNNTATPGTALSPVNDIVNALAYSVPGASGSKILQSQLTNTVLSPDINSFLTARDAGGITTKPQAWLNVVLLDEHLNPVPLTSDGNNSYFQQVGANNVFTTHTANRLMTKSGYVYIYVSNETPNIDVFFDNLQVTQVRGPLLETDNYMPFGLQMAGINSQAANELEAKIKFQGQELQHKEFSDGSGLETYEFKWRMDDPQTGRFWQIDPLADKYVYNSTYAFSEDKVTGHIELEGLEAISTTKEKVAREAAMRESLNRSAQQNTRPQIVNWNNIRSSQIAPANNPLPGTYAADAQQQRTEELNVQNGLNADGSKTPIGKLLDNKTFQKAANNLILPIIMQAAGEGLLKLAGPVVPKMAEGASGLLQGRTIIVDENLSPKLVDELKSAGFKAIRYANGTSDLDIITMADKNNSIVLTNNIADFAPGKWITTIKVAESMKSSAAIPDVIAALKNLAQQANASPEMLNVGNNLSLAAFKVK